MVVDYAHFGWSLIFMFVWLLCAFQVLEQHIYFLKSLWNHWLHFSTLGLILAFSLCLFVTFFSNRNLTLIIYDIFIFLFGSSILVVSELLTYNPGRNNFTNWRTVFVYSSFYLLVKTLFSKVISKAPFSSPSVWLCHMFMFVKLYSIWGSSSILADFFKIHSLSCIVVLVWQMALSHVSTTVSYRLVPSLPKFLVLPFHSFNNLLPTSNLWHLFAFLVLVKTGKWGNLWVWYKLK